MGSQALLSIIALLTTGTDEGATKLDGRQLAMSLRDNVVAIATYGRTGEVSWSERGFGFLVGRSGGTSVIVTAGHILRGRAPGPSYTDSVRVRFLDDLSGIGLKGRVLPVRIEGSDLGVLDVQRHDPMKWTPDCLGARLDHRPGVGALFIGRQGGWYVPSSPGSINNLSAEDLMGIDGLDILPGCSGAPLISPTGVVGMIVSDSPDGAQAIPIDRIRQVLQLSNPHLPWELSPTQMAIERDRTPSYKTAWISTAVTLVCSGAALVLWERSSDREAAHAADPASDAAYDEYTKAWQQAWAATIVAGTSAAATGFAWYYCHERRADHAKLMKEVSIGMQRGGVSISFAGHF
jgi:hypothetical protein